MLSLLISSTVDSRPISHYPPSIIVKWGKSYCTWLAVTGLICPNKLADGAASGVSAAVMIF